MQTVVKQHNMTLSVLGEQPVKSTEYRPIKYLHQVNVDDGALIYNALTAELLFLDNNDLSVLQKPQQYDIKVLEPLIKQWLLVPADNDDLKLSKQFADLMALLNNTDFSAPKNNYIVLPTTDCNARCFYCYELSGNRRNMTEQTAYDVAEYIAKKCDPNKKIVFRWFGGEPLYNYKVIDVICDTLAEKGLEYGGSIISNAYLFDDELVKKAKEKWHIDWVQITLDGTEKIYNRIKAYIYKDVNAFERVIDNMGKLLDAGIALHTRLNMDEHNEDDLYELTDYLFEKFGKYKKFFLYANPLFEESTHKIATRVAEERHRLLNKHMDLRKYIADSDHSIRTLLNVSDQMTHCMADRDNSLLILPDGNIGKCEHFTDDHYIGSIYSDDIDMNMVNWFKKSSPKAPECDFCELRPYCLSLDCCRLLPRRCDEIDKKFTITDLETKMIHSYRKFKNKKEKNL